MEEERGKAGEAAERQIIRTGSQMRTQKIKQSKEKVLTGDGWGGYVEVE